MGLQRELAALALRATPLPGQKNFLSDAGVPTPVPHLSGSIGAVGHEPFMAEDLRRLFDLMVIFTIGDFPDGKGCSSYFDPESPWYNVFYGAYGVRSYKPDGSPWGFRRDGRPNMDEMLEVPWLDYTLVWGGLCPDTPDGQRLFNSILDRMTPLYALPR